MMWFLTVALAAEVAATAPASLVADSAEPVPGELGAATGPDRSQPPPVPAPDLLVLPDAQEVMLSPGVSVWYARVPGVRKVAVHAVMRRGMLELDGGVTQLGRATGSLAAVAGGELTGAEMSEQSDLYEIDLRSAAMQHMGVLTVDVPLEELGRGLGLAQKVLRTPTFPKKDVKRWVLDQSLFYTVTGPTSQGRVASSALSFAWFPSDHPYGARPDLTEFKVVKPKALQANWAAWLKNAPMTVVVVGDLPYADVEPFLKPLFAGVGAGAPPGDALAVDPPTKSRVIGVNMPGQAQTALRLRLAAPPRDHADEAGFDAMNFLLGGHFLSRLNRNLREEKGFTYGAWSSYGNDETWGAVTVSVDVKTENAAAAIQEIERELARLRDEPVPPEEMDAMRRSNNADWNRTFTTAQSAISMYRQALYARTTASGLRKDLLALNAVTAEDVARIASAWLGEDRPRVWVVVGDRDTLQPQLESAGLTAEWIDPKSAIVGSF